MNNTLMGNYRENEIKKMMNIKIKEKNMPKEFVLFDLEAVSDDTKGDWMEIIEIGAYKVRVIEKELPVFALMDFGKEQYRFDIPAQREVEIIDSYHTFIKPVFHTSISKQLSKLIHMDKDKWNDIRLNAPSYDEIIHEFVEWAGKDTVLVSWSSSDEDMIVTNCDKNYIYDLPNLSFLDLQFEYDAFKKSVRRTGLGLAMEEQHIEFEGEQHTALADTFNMLHIFEKMIERHGMGFTKHVSNSDAPVAGLA